MPYGGDLVSQLEESAFKARLRRLDGTPEEVLNNAELMDLLLETLRADFELNERYCASRRRAQLDCSLTILGGTADPEVRPSELEEWRHVTHGSFSLNICAGGHFFIREHLDELLTVITRNLAATSGEAAHKR